MIQNDPGQSGAAPGRGRVEIVRRGERSVVTRAVATSPLRLLTPRNHGRGAWVYTATYGGGLVDGDAIQLDISVGAGRGGDAVDAGSDEGLPFHPRDEQ